MEQAGRGGRRVAALVRARKPHGTLQILLVIELNIDPDMVQQAACEELRLLLRRKAAGVRHPGLERIQVGVQQQREWQTRQIRQVIGAERRPKTRVA